MESCIIMVKNPKVWLETWFFYGPTFFPTHHLQSRHSTPRVSIVTGLQVGRLGFDSDRGMKGIFLFVLTGSELLFNGYRKFFLPGVERSGREVGQSHPSSAEVKNVWSYTSTPPYVLMAWCLVKQGISRPHQLWFPPRLLFNGYRWLFPRGWS